MNREALKDLALAVIDTESRAVSELRGRIDDAFADACGLMLDCKGRVVVLGVGKSGHIGGKIAATLASTGTPAFFVHPAEASHGDLGMITREDVVLALSNSGETEEMKRILPVLKRLGVPIIALTGRPESTLAQHADVHLDVSVHEEACPLGLAPTSSTTVALVMGDALAVSLLQTRGFTRDDFARSHPAGVLGRKLLLHISDIMHTGEDMPRCSPESTVSEAIVEMTRKRLGLSAVVDAELKILGVYTDGDLRRTLDRNLDPHVTRIAEVMTQGARTIRPEALAVEAVGMMQEFRIQAVLVADDSNRLVGVLNFQDLLAAGVV
jgi:arabinose-5-phosphate isomerase